MGASLSAAGLTTRSVSELTSSLLQLARASVKNAATRASFPDMGGGKSADNHNVIVLLLLMWLYTTPQSYDFFLKLPRIREFFFLKKLFWARVLWIYYGLGDCRYTSGRVTPKRVFSIQYSVFFAIVTLSMVINCK